MYVEKWSSFNPGPHNCPLILPQELKKQLEEKEDSGCRESLLHFITAFSMRMSRAGLEADMRHVVTLVLLVDRLDDPDPSLRLTAANLLVGMHPV